MAAALRRRALGLPLGLNSGALYRCFRSLEAQGWIESRGISRSGARPAREEFGLTELGRSALRDRLRGLLAGGASAEQLGAGLAFLGLLSPEQALEMLRERAWGLQRRLRVAREDYRAQLGRGTPRGALLDLEHQLTLGESEVVWLRSLVEEVAAGELGWAVR